jgi:hypothetical protein
MLSVNSVPSRPGKQPGSAQMPTLRYIRNTAVVSRDVNGETIVVPICRGAGDLESVYIFNAVGRDLWFLLQESRSSEELANWLTSNYEVGEEQALSDVHSYLADLQDVGLVHAV